MTLSSPPPPSIISFPLFGKKCSYEEVPINISDLPEPKTVETPEIVSLVPNPSSAQPSIKFTVPP